MQHLLFVKSFIFLISLISFLNVSSHRLANNDLLSLDPFGPTLGGSSSYSAPASTGNFYTSSFAFAAGLFFRGLSYNCVEKLRFPFDKNDVLGYDYEYSP